MSSTQSLIGNLAMLIAGVLGFAFLWDYAASHFGYAPFALCYALRPMVYVAQTAAVVLTTVGLVVWVASMFKSEVGAGLTVGGFLLGVIPMVLPHYLGASCLAVP